MTEGLPAAQPKRETFGRMRDTVGRPGQIPLPCHILLSLLLDNNHPSDAEAVIHHAEARGKESFSERHFHFSAVSESGEEPIGLRLVSRGDRQREALENWL